jgi:hypothetical protein
MERPNWISRLLEQGSAPYSQINSTAATSQVEQLIVLGLVGVEIQGRKRRIVVRDAGQLQRWADANFPAAEHPAPEQPRAQNIARHRNSKTGPTSHQVQPLLLRWFDPDPTAPLARLSARYGLASLLTDRLTALELPDRWYLLTVENWEPFYTLAYDSLTVPIMAVYLGGNAAEVLLTSLAQLTPPPTEILHFGDFDWAGLAIFQRVQAVLPAARLYQPSGLGALFQRYANRQLITDQAGYAQLDLNHPASQPIIDLIARYNTGLEQEIVSPPTEADFTEAN